MSVASHLREPLVTGGNPKLADITDAVVAPMENKPTKLWWLAFIPAATLFVLGFSTMGYQISEGIGTWGLNKTVGWGWDITNFVWWVGIGHAGTAISAILFLFRQRWRTAINRSAEAMTILAVICAAIFPIIHMGRPWFGWWWFAPLPNMRGPLWVNFRSPLLWDFFAISTYFSISCVFWYFGLIPDLATFRDRTNHKIKKLIYGIMSFGWNGSNRDWSHYEIVYGILAGLAAPLVLSVHTIVSMDFATSVIPGWHTTIFPPYFVAGALFSGFAMVMTLLIIARKTQKLEHIITINHIDNMAKVVLATGMLVGLAYSTEFLIGWYSGSNYEGFIFFSSRMKGPYAWAYWIMITCNVISPQIFWVRKFRRNMVLVFVMSIFVNIGMWFERFVIIVTSLNRDYLPSSWSMYSPTWVEVLEYGGTIGFFFTFYLLFVRFLPTIAIAEVKSVAAYAQREEHAAAGSTGAAAGVLSPAPAAPKEEASHV
ncbi:MAG: polysulfide reductase NrfD [Myxococcales bacterium]|nr:polysulfide reductase NrfD [Myxococcales bacterium]